MFKCPNKKNHTKKPLEVKCPECGLFMIWEKGLVFSRTFAWVVNIGLVLGFTLSFASIMYMRNNNYHRFIEMNYDYDFCLYFLCLWFIVRRAWVYIDKKENRCQ